MDLIEAQKLVIEWAATTDSYEKLGFMKAVCSTFGLEEVHHAKTILRHIQAIPENRRRTWTGLKPKEASARQKRIIEKSENPEWREERPVVLPSLSRPSVSRRDEQVPKPWWSAFDLETVRGFDCEHVHLKGIESSARIRAGKIGIACFDEDDALYKTAYDAPIYHKPGTFDTNPKMSAVSGIKANDLVNGVPLSIGKKIVCSQLETSLTIVVDGDTDFNSCGLNIKDFDTFNLQDFYKRPKSDLKGSIMSLRDIYFLEFNEDFQGTVSHSALEDAKATLKIFIDGYVPRNVKKPTKHLKYHFEEFDCVRLKDMDKERKFFCNTDKMFKDWKVKRCVCPPCNRLFR